MRKALLRAKQSVLSNGARKHQPRKFGHKFLPDIRYTTFINPIGSIYISLTFVGR